MQTSLASDYCRITATRGNTALHLVCLTAAQSPTQCVVGGLHWKTVYNCNPSVIAPHQSLSAS